LYVYGIVGKCDTVGETSGEVMHGLVGLTLSHSIFCKRQNDQHLSLPCREQDFAASVETAVAYARALGCAKVHAMAGNRPAGVEEARLQDTYLKNISRAGRRRKKV